MDGPRYKLFNPVWLNHTHSIPGGTKIKSGARQGFIHILKYLTFIALYYFTHLGTVRAQTRQEGSVSQCLLV